MAKFPLVMSSFNYRKIWFIKTVLILFFVTAAFSFLETGNSAKTNPEKANSSEISQAVPSIHDQIDWEKLRLNFVPNQGQYPTEVGFAVQTSAEDLFFTSKQLVFNLTTLDQKNLIKENVRGEATGKFKSRSAKYSSKTIRLNLLGSDPKAAITGEEEKTGKMNFLKGDDPAKWATDVSTFGKIRYSKVYPGIDLVFYGNEGNIQYDFAVAPQADPAKIGFNFDGVDRLRIDDTGDLIAAVGKNEIRLTRPVLYQLDEIGNHNEVDGAFQLNKNNTVGFAIGKYDKTKTLIIDPVLSYSSFLGGTRDDIGNAVAVDPQGYMYVTGTTRSPDFPVSSGPGAFPDTTDDIFVTKLNPQGTEFVYSTVIGGNQQNDVAYDIAVDNAGQACIVGQKAATGSFVTKLNAQGNGFIYSTHYGATNWAVTMDSSGRAYVTGEAFGSGLPLVNPLSGAIGRKDAYIGIFAANSATLEFSSYLGGTDDDIAHDVAVDPNGNIYIVGETTSSDFPLVNPRQPAPNSFQEAFITKLAPNGTGILYSTYFGGNAYDTINGADTDPLGNLYVAGRTNAAVFPTGSTPPIQPAFGGFTDAFVAKFDPSGANLLYSTYLGGPEEDQATGIVVNDSGQAYVAGYSKSIDFPTYRSLKSKSPLTKSADRGNTWRNNVDGMSATHVYALTIDTQNPANILAGTDKGVYRSTDSGENWIRSAGAIPLRKDVLTIDVAFDPSNALVAYAGVATNSTGAGQGVYKSFDGGQTWAASSNGLSDIHALAVDPSNSNIIYAGSDTFSAGAPMYKSTNGGASWVNISRGTVFNISDIKLDPTNPSIVYTTSTSSSGAPVKVARSANGGDSWQSISTGVPGGTSIDIDPQMPSRLYLGAAGGVYRSDNSGASWQQSFSIPPVNGNTFVTVDPVDPLNVYAGTEKGLYFSHDRGMTWTLNTSGLIYKSVGAVAVDNTNNGVMYMATTPGIEFDAFVSKINAAGTAFEYSTLFGGLADVSVFPDDYAYSIAKGSTGSVYTTGWTRINNFPTTPGALSNHFGGSYEAYVNRLDDAFQIKGVVTSNGSPLDGVELELAGTNSESAVTQLDGKYKIDQARAGGSFVLTPHKIGYSFSPPSQTINNLSSDTTVNFVAFQNDMTIFGQVIDDQGPVSDVTISMSGSRTQSTQTNASGLYSLFAPRDGSYTLVPSKPGLIFTPSSRQFDNLTTDEMANFVASAGYIISGQVKANGIGLSNMQITMSGSQSVDVLTDANGNFSIPAAAGGTYTVRANSSIYTFAPPLVTINNLSAPQDVQFTATISRPKTNGKIIFTGTAVVNFVSNSDIFLYSPSGNINLSNNPAEDVSAVWSPTGKKIAFASNRDGRWEIYVMNADGSGQTRLTNNGANNTEPSWSPDGSRLTFVKTPFGTSSAEIFAMNADGSGQINLTNNSWFEYSPAWSPDGNEIAFVSEQDGNAEIYSMRADGSGQRRLTNNSGPDKNPAWFPSGDKIAFDRGEGLSREIYVMQRNGSSQTAITQNGLEDKMPSLSPDGTKLIYSATDPSCNNFNIKMANIDGSQGAFVSGCDTSDSNWQAQPKSNVPFDFDGDGKADVSIFRPSSGIWWYVRSIDGADRLYQFGQGTDMLTPADYTGDGKADIAFFRPSTGEWFVQRSEDAQFYSFTFGTNGDIPAPGDYDGDGKADFAVFRPSISTWFISKSSGGISIQQFGSNGDVPTVADYDGDGKADIAIYRPSLGQWWVQQSTAGLLAFQFGTSTDKPVQGDYTGDGKTDIAIYRPSTGEWYILTSETFGVYAFPFGAAGDIAAPGDYDGDGKTDAAVFRPSSGAWFILGSTSGVTVTFWGSAGDKPVPSAFIP
jgi:dipeptidyl aminopeptidase/acylaminoacyl peptidase/photosystem II stability/assembly factor-like uncharacterized protein